MHFDSQYVTEEAIRRILREELERVVRPSAPEQMVDLAGMALILDVSKDTVYRMARSDEIPSHRLGRAWRFLPSEVREHLSRPRDPWMQSARSRGRKRKSF